MIAIMLHKYLMTADFYMILNVGNVMIIFALQGVCNLTVQTRDCIVCRARCNQQMWDSVARKAEDYRL